MPRRQLQSVEPLRRPASQSTVARPNAGTRSRHSGFRPLGLRPAVEGIEQAAQYSSESGGLVAKCATRLSIAALPDPDESRSRTGAPWRTVVATSAPSSESNLARSSTISPGHSSSARPIASRDPMLTSRSSELSRSASRSRLATCLSPARSSRAASNSASAAATRTPSIAATTHSSKTATTTSRSSLRPPRQPGPTPAAIHEITHELGPQRHRLTVRRLLRVTSKRRSSSARRLKKCETEQVARSRRPPSTGIRCAGQAVKTRHSDRRTRGEPRGGRGNYAPLRDLYRRLQERGSVPRRRRSSSRPTASGISTISRHFAVAGLVGFQAPRADPGPNGHALPGSLATATVSP